MPAYDFQCKKCGHKFERFLKISNRKQPESEPCPQCNEEGQVEQQISGTSFAYTAERLPVNTALKEKFQQIHENTPGSCLNQVSTITPI